MRVLVTGDRGYLGSVLVPMLRRVGHEVVGLDLGLYEHLRLRPASQVCARITGDALDVGTDDLRGVDAVVHLAGLDPLGPGTDAARILDVNVGAAQAVIGAAARAGCHAVVLASSIDVLMPPLCAAPAHRSTGWAGTDPVAAAHRAAEEVFTAAGLATTVLRLPRLYGSSPSLRLDDDVNFLVASAMTRARTSVSDPSSGRARPLLHVKDASRAVLHALDESARPGRSASPTVVEVGRTQDVLAMRDVARVVAAITGNAVEVTEAAHAQGVPEPVDRLERAWPRFDLRWTLAKGVRDLCRELSSLHVDAHAVEWLRRGRVEAVRRREPAPTLVASASEPAMSW